MPDVEALLFPQLLTVLVQLGSTFVIYLLYKRFLHEPVLKILDKKADDYQHAYTEIENLKEEQSIERKNFEEEKKAQKEMLERSKEMMLKEIEDMREKLIEETNTDILRLKNSATESIRKEKEAMLDEVEQELVSVAYEMTEKVLEGYRFDEQEILAALEKEMDRAHARS